LAEEGGIAAKLLSPFRQPYLVNLRQCVERPNPFDRTVRKSNRIRGQNAIRSRTVDFDVAVIVHVDIGYVIGRARLSAIIGFSREGISTLVEDQTPGSRDREPIHAAPERFRVKGILYHFAAIRQQQFTGNMIE
jgi:hypothetical protein